MFERCLFCRGAFGRNQTIESFAATDRAAFDARRGRLWAVCPHCRRWTLTPIEDRWEIVEELERLTRDRGTVLGRTENIGLFRVGDLDVVRVGAAPRREEAWWRYGREVRRRHQEAGRIVRRGKVKDAFLATVLIGLPVWGFTRPSTWIRRARRRQFGKMAWHGDAACAACGTRDQRLRFDERVTLIQDAQSPDAIALRGACRRCGRSRNGGNWELHGTAAEQVLRRLLAHENFAGAPDAHLSRAVELVDEARSAAAFQAAIVSATPTLGSLSLAQRVALEIVVNEANERALLELELEELEERWREEEIIAAIADRELTPTPVWARFRSGP